MQWKEQEAEEKLGTGIRLRGDEQEDEEGEEAKEEEEKGEDAEDRALRRGLIKAGRA